MIRPDASSWGGLFAPLRPLLDRMPGTWSWAALELVCADSALRTRSGHTLSFVPPLDDGLTYEERIWRRGEVATRPDNWHDFFNALVWLTFPRTKAEINALHVSAPIAQSTVRGRRRDALTHFDECGAIVVACEPILLTLLRDFRWKELFWERRRELIESLRCFVFGHATYEQLIQPYRGLTAKAVLYEVSSPWLRWPLAAQLADLDQRVADDLACGKHQDPRCLHPFPLLGLPGVTAASESAAYFDDLWHFRPGRGSTRV